MIYVKEGINYEPRNDILIYKDRELESFFIEVINEKAQKRYYWCGLSPSLYDIKSGNLTINISDHLPSFFIMPRGNRIHLPNAKDIYVREMKKFDRINFAIDLLKIDWTEKLKDAKMMQIKPSSISIGKLTSSCKNIFDGRNKESSNFKQGMQKKIYAMDKWHR